MGNPQLALAPLSISRFPRPLTKVGTSDLNLFYTTTRRRVAYGPGDASLSHTEQEAISDSDYFRSIEVYSSLVRKLLSPREWEAQHRAGIAKASLKYHRLFARGVA